jgi:hypothetical protein
MRIPFRDLKHKATPEQIRQARVSVEALHALSLARTALDDPTGLSDEDFAGEQTLREYAINRIDDAMRLLGADDEEKTARFYHRGELLAAAEVLTARLQAKKAERERDEAEERHALAQAALREWEREHVLRSYHLAISGREFRRAEKAEGALREIAQIGQPMSGIETAWTCAQIARAYFAELEGEMNEKQ